MLARVRFVTANLPPLHDLPDAEGGRGLGRIVRAMNAASHRVAEAQGPGCGDVMHPWAGGRR